MCTLAMQMRKTRLSFYRWTVVGVLLAGLVLPVGGLSTLPKDAWAQGNGVVCGKFKKKTGALKRARLAAGPECKKKEERLIDLGEAATAPCVGNASLRLLPSLAPDACRMHDGDQASCVASYQALFGTACWYYRGKCLPCTRSTESITGPTGPPCINSCEIRPACADPGRTLFAGWPEEQPCRDITSEPVCNTAWAVVDNNQDTDEYAASCYWDPGAGQCYECDLYREDDGDCTNSCGTPPQPTCGGRTLASSCSVGAPMEATCNARYVLDDFGLAQSCYYDMLTCRRCDLEASLTGKCENACP